jgi:hypothetical protein
MAQMIPALNEEQLNSVKSKAEVKLYKAFKEYLSNDFVVFFEVCWILKKQDKQARDGETDFVICHPDYGYLCIEVKGGGIGCDSSKGQWYSIDRYNKKHFIKNPTDQAKNAKYSLLTKIKESTSIPYVSNGHAVFFPDISNIKTIIRSDLPEILIGSSRDLTGIKSWIKGALEYWIDESNGRGKLDRTGIEKFKKVFARSFEVKPLVAEKLLEQEENRLKLTENQMQILDMLRKSRRIVISGGAGTGKTVLAVEKAKRLASEGFKTLLTCYNRQLSDSLAIICQGIENLEVMSFHQLCYYRIQYVQKTAGRDLLGEAESTYPGANKMDVHYPVALSYSIDVLQEHQYDAIVCDEGQDFKEEYWLPIEMLLNDYENSPLYVFFDDNQNLYSKASTFPIQAPPVSLVTNCRNTKQIHDISYQYYQGEGVLAPNNTGDDVKVIATPTIQQQAKKIHGKIVNLIVSEYVSPGDIAVLILDNMNKKAYFDLLNNLPLPGAATWLEEDIKGPNNVLLETVHRFKGLESQIIFLWGLGNSFGNNELLYVGLSRAKSLLYLVGTHEDCQQIHV